MVLRHVIDHEEIVDGILYRTFKEDELDKGIDFYFDVFLKGEPSTRSFGGYNERHPAMVEQMRWVLEDGVSVIAIDPSQGDKMVGFRTSWTITRGEPVVSTCLEESLKIYPPTHAYIMHLFESLMSPAGILVEYPDVNKIYDMFTVACHSDYRGRGIATELVRQSFKVAKKAGCDCSIVLSTNDFTRRIFKKLGMETMKTTPWDECTVNGQQIFGKVESSFVTSHFIRL